MNRIQLVCTNHGFWNGSRIEGVEITARLYFENGTYFEGKGRTDAEAIGNLVCRCRERFNATFDVREDFEAKP